MQPAPNAWGRAGGSSSLCAETIATQFGVGAHAFPLLRFLVFSMFISLYLSRAIARSLARWLACTNQRRAPPPHTKRHDNLNIAVVMLPQVPVTALARHVERGEVDAVLLEFLSGLRMSPSLCERLRDSMSAIHSRCIRHAATLIQDLRWRSMCCSAFVPLPSEWHAPCESMALRETPYVVASRIWPCAHGLVRLQMFQIRSASKVNDMHTMRCLSMKDEFVAACRIKYNATLPQSMAVTTMTIGTPIIRNH